ncbi:MAG: helicase-related protein, partial [Vicingaceae bacterium]
VPSPIEYLVNRQYLAKINYQVLNATKGESQSEYYNDLHSMVKSECEKIILNKKNCIIFAESLSHAIALNIFLSNNDIENELIIGETPNTKRKDYLERFGDEKDNLSILINFDILATGIDVPGLNSIMILRNIQSAIIALQILGRAMRGKLNGGNKENTIFLTKDNQNRLIEYKVLEDQVLNN